MSYILFLSSSTALEFTIEPSDQIVPEGSSVLLQCAGQSKTSGSKKLKDGKITPNIRWRGPDDADIGIETLRTQTPNGSLFINNVNENHGLTGNYQCLLSVDGVGTIVSRKARLSVAGEFDMFEFDLNTICNVLLLAVEEGNSINYECKFDLSIWYINGS